MYILLYSTYCTSDLPEDESSSSEALYVTFKRPALSRPCLAISIVLQYDSRLRKLVKNTHYVKIAHNLIYDYYAHPLTWLLYG